MNDKVLAQLNQWAAQIGHAVSHAAPVVWQTAVAVKRADSIGNLITLVLGALILGFVARWLWSVCRHHWDKLGVTSDDGYQVLAIFAGIGSIVGGIACLCIVIFGLLDQWLWIGAFAPQLAVAHDVMTRVLTVPGQ